MHTKFKLLFASNPPDIDLIAFNLSLPSQMTAYEEPDGIYIKVTSERADDEECQYFVDRELERYRYLTAVTIKAEMTRRTVTKSLEVARSIHAKLPSDISPQKWSTALTTQLKLWSMALDSNDNNLKIILYFQIIELSHPLRSGDFPKYSDSSIPPNPLTEAKFIRDLVVHSGDVGNKNLQKYCEYLGISKSMFDPTNIDHMNIMKEKVALLETEAKKVIEKAL